MEEETNFSNPFCLAFVVSKGAVYQRGGFYVGYYGQQRPADKFAGDFDCQWIRRLADGNHSV